MAAIDKIYVSKYGDYKLFVDWCAKQPKIKDKYGKEASLMSYIFKYDKWEDVNCRAVIFGTPYYIDAYLIRNMIIIESDLNLQSPWVTYPLYY